MDTTKLIAIVSLILALSMASQRLVEIVKNLVPWLQRGSLDEPKRVAAIHVLATIAGIITAYLTRDFIPTELASLTRTEAVIGLGLLASGGSGLWNSILDYMGAVSKIGVLKG